MHTTRPSFRNLIATNPGVQFNPVVLPPSFFLPKEWGARTPWAADALPTHISGETVLTTAGVLDVLICACGGRTESLLELLPESELDRVAAVKRALSDSFGERTGVILNWIASHDLCANVPLVHEASEEANELTDRVWNTPVATQNPPPVATPNSPSKHDQISA